jgi:hypothetical protein
MVPHDPLPEWQQKSLSRLLDLYTADSVPNSQRNAKKNKTSLELLRKSKSVSSLLLQISIQADIRCAAGP